MPVLYIEATNDTPKVIFDPENNHFEISDKSLPEDAIGFFQPIFDWLNQYIDEPKNENTFVFALEYFSTSTAKQLTKIFFLLDKLSEKAPVKMRHIGVKESFGQVGTKDYLQKVYHLTAEDIVDAVKDGLK